MITDNTGAKKIEGTDNWRLIFDAHNDSVDAHSAAIANIATVITGTNNNSGHIISSGEYFIANGAKYKATAAIGVNEAWANSAQSVTDHDLINAINSKITDQIKTASKSSLTITTDSIGKYMLGANEKPSISGYSPIAANISNFSSDDLGGSTYPPSIVLSDNGTFYFMGSPNKTYHSIGVRAVMRKN